MFYIQYFADGIAPYSYDGTNPHPVKAINDMSDHLDIFLAQLDGITDMQYIEHEASTINDLKYGRVSTFFEHKESHALGICAVSFEIGTECTKIWAVPHPESSERYEQLKSKYFKCSSTYLHRNFMSYLPYYISQGIKFILYFQNGGTYILNGPNDVHQGWTVGRGVSQSITCNFRIYDQGILEEIQQPISKLYDKVIVLQQFATFEDIPPYEKNEFCGECIRKFHGQQQFEANLCVYRSLSQIMGSLNTIKNKITMRTHLSLPSLIECKPCIPDVSAARISNNGSISTNKSMNKNKRRKFKKKSKQFKRSEVTRDDGRTEMVFICDWVDDDHNECKKQLNTISSMKNHWSGHTVLKAKKHYCDLCDIAYKRPVRLREHNRSHHSDGSNIYKCKHCWKQFNEKTSRDDHRAKCSKRATT